MADFVELGTGRAIVSETERQRKARERVAAEASRGHEPSAAYSPGDLEWAFGDEYAAELVELEQLAERVSTEKRDREQAIQTKAVLARETKRVMDEWYREEQAKLRAKAEKIARQRLGWAGS